MPGGEQGCPTGPRAGRRRRRPERPLGCLREAQSRTRVPVDRSDSLNTRSGCDQFKCRRFRSPLAILHRTSTHTHRGRSGHLAAALRSEYGASDRRRKESLPRPRGSQRRQGNRAEGVSRRWMVWSINREPGKSPAMSAIDGWPRLARCCAQAVGMGSVRCGALRGLGAPWTPGSGRGRHRSSRRWCSGPLATSSRRAADAPPRLCAPTRA
jgi:hypothetical protein